MTEYAPRPGGPSDSVSGVAPGRYRVQLLPMTPAGQWSGVSEGEPIAVAEGESLTVNLDAEPPADNR